MNTPSPMPAVQQEDVAELFREPGQGYLSPVRFSAVLELDLFELAKALGVHPNTMRLHPESARTQERLRDYICVYQALMNLTIDPGKAAFYMQNMPIAALGHRTLFQTVRQGGAEDAVHYLLSISSGYVG